MSPDEVVGMAIFFGSIVSIVFIVMVGSLIKTWMKRGSTKSLPEKHEFLQALHEFKENMEARLSNLEEIVSAEKPSYTLSKPGKIKKSYPSAIDLELEEEFRSEANSEAQNIKLRNMLNH